MNAIISIAGEVMSVITKTYEDKTNTNIQLVKLSESKGLEVLKVKLTEDSDIAKVQQGQLISVPVNIANVNGNLYYSQSGPMKFPRDK